MAALTSLEREQLLEFRERISDIELNDFRRNNDMHLVTWLRARDHNLKKAEEMFRKSDAWMKTTDIENLVSNWKPPKEYLKNFAYELCGFDAEDSPVLFARMGQWDMRTVIENGEKEPFVKYQHYSAAMVLEHAKARAEDKNKYISQFILVIDMEGYSLRQLTSLATIETQLECLREFEANYPETMKACYVININKLFGLIYNIFKPFLGNGTLSKIQPFDTNSEQWKSILKNNVLNVDARIFTNKFRNNNNEEVNLDFDLATIKAGEHLKLDFEILEEGKKLSWKFKTDGHDIGFGLNYFDAAKNFEVPIIKTERKPANQTVQENSLICSKVGKYTFVFDNTYSRFRSKTIYYDINVCEQLQ